VIRSETVRLGRERREGLGEGLKPSILWTQVSFQMFTLMPEEINQQAPFLTIDLHLRIPFHKQEAEGEAEELRKPSLWRYLVDNASIHSRFYSFSIFQPSFANKDLWSSIALKPRPPTTFGEQILSQPSKVRLWLFSAGKPHQNFLKAESILRQNFFGRRNRDIEKLGRELATDLIRVVQATWDRSFNFQREILLRILDLSSSKARLLFLWKKRGRSRCLDVGGIGLRLRMDCMEAEMAGEQFLLRIKEDLAKFTC
jgi:hypothetical protein